MANNISPLGAQNWMHAGGGAVTEELEPFWIASSDATPIFHGDLVCAAATVISSALGSGGYGAYITQGTSQTSVVWVGVFRGCKYFSAVTNRVIDSKYWPGSGATGDVKAYVVTDPNMRFTIQVSSLAVLGASQAGMAFPVAVNSSGGAPSSAGGNTTTGLSGMQLASSFGIAPGLSVQGYPFRLIDFLSNWGAGANPTQPSIGVGSSQSFVNGMDNTTPGQVVIVQPYNWINKSL